MSKHCVGKIDGRKIALNPLLPLPLLLNVSKVPIRSTAFPLRRKIIQIVSGFMRKPFFPPAEDVVVYAGGMEVDG